MTINQRIKIIRKHYRLTQGVFAEKLGVKQNTISVLEKDGSNVTESIKMILKSSFDININWLETGEGEMIANNLAIDSTKQAVGSNNEPYINKLPNLNTDKRGVPYYDIDFVGGFDVMENSQLLNPTYYIDFLPFNDSDCWLNVTGKSMGPLIAHGDIVALKEVHDWKTFLLEGEIYAVVTHNGFRTIKIIGRDVTNNDNYLLIPYNKNGDYHPQPIPKNVITKVYRVKGAIKKFF